MEIIVEVSARHIHLSEEDFYVLFGENASLTIKKQLSQPGQFACLERVDITGPKGTINGVSVLGPFRKNTQLELSITDSRKIGIAPFIRESNDLERSPGCKITGPVGEIEISQGVIVAKRHIHMSPQIAEEQGIKNGQIVSVKINSGERSLIFGETVARISEEYSPAFHVDTDEANAAGINGETNGTIIM
jgi:putative phosphotransacetylase